MLVTWIDAQSTDLNSITCDAAAHLSDQKQVHSPLQFPAHGPTGAQMPYLPCINSTSLRACTHTSSIPSTRSHRRTAVIPSMHQQHISKSTHTHLFNSQHKVPHAHSCHTFLASTACLKEQIHTPHQFPAHGPTRAQRPCHP